MKTCPQLEAILKAGPNSEAGFAAAFAAVVMSLQAKDNLDSLTQVVRVNELELQNARDELLHRGDRQVREGEGRPAPG